MKTPIHEVLGMDTEQWLEHKLARQEREQIRKQKLRKRERRKVKTDRKEEIKKAAEEKAARKMTAKLSGHFKRCAKPILQEIMYQRGCMSPKCHWRGPFDKITCFHHVNPETKTDSALDQATPDQKIEEMEKCIVLCHNCHHLAHSSKILNDGCDNTISLTDFEKYVIRFVYFSILDR